MSHGALSYRSALGWAALFCITLFGCSDSGPVSPQDKDVAALRQAVAPYHDLSAAEQAGYTVVVADPGDGHTCLSDVQLGGMGVHYLKTTLVNDTVAVTQPEVVIYEPQQDGSLKFVGVEFIIPYSIHGEDQAAPELFGQKFMKNATFQLWGLHVWVGRSNPSGLFAMWNPAVSCEFAQ